MSNDVTLTAQAAANLHSYGKHHTGRHLAPLHEAMAAKAVNALIIFKDTVGGFLDESLPNIVIAFDLIDGGTGPSGFNAKLIDDLSKVAVGVIVVTKFDSAKPYEQSVALALQSRGVVVLVETVESYASEWLALVNANQKVGIWSLWAGEVAGRA